MERRRVGSVISPVRFGTRANSASLAPQTVILIARPCVNNGRRPVVVQFHEKAAGAGGNRTRAPSISNGMLYR
jgi:hypothetical protein